MLSTFYFTLIFLNTEKENIYCYCFFHNLLLLLFGIKNLMSFILYQNVRQAL